MSQVARSGKQGVCSSRTGTVGWSGHWEQVHCRGDAATIWPATSFVSSCPLSELNAMGSLICYLIICPCDKNSLCSMPLAHTTHPVPLLFIESSYIYYLLQREGGGAGGLGGVSGGGGAGTGFCSCTCLFQNGIET